MSVAFDHFAFVFSAVLQDNGDSSVQLLDEYVERLLAWFHLSTLDFRYNLTLRQVITYKSLMKGNSAGLEERKSKIGTVCTSSSGENR